MKAVKIFLGMLAILLFVSVFLTFGVNTGKEIVQREYLSCIVSICVEDPTIGNKCEILMPKLVKVQITVDDNEYTRISLVQTGIDCK